ncbi:MAG: hypothetical protein E7310_03350 [Clostridiales bacterium]|nr:hypothetical protein [Clostridiales bacterium]
MGEILAIVAVILAFVVIILTFIYMKMSMDEKNGTSQINKNNKSNEEVKSGKTTQSYSTQSIFDFMEFDKIEDNMIIQKNGKRYLMAIECQGINYDLMSSVEKNSIESGFVQLLNTLRYPIQIYTQTRTINLENSLQNYRKRLEDIEHSLTSKENKYKQMQQSGRYTEKELNKQHMEIIKEKNLYDYGKDIIFNTERMSLNRNVLRKQYYIIVSYYAAEAGNDLLGDDEVKNLAFSELYTRCQSIIRTLSACEIAGNILDSYELVDMLYNAYNRDEAETYGLEKALRAGYDELYTTAQDVLDKRMEALDEVIEQKALEQATMAVEEARSEKEKKVIKKEMSIEELAEQMAEMIIMENEAYLGADIAEEAIKKVKKSSTKEKGGIKDGSKEEIKRTRRIAKS